MFKRELIQEILSGYPLHVMGIHGPSHWARVLETGLKLAKKTGANTDIVTLFAVFHDSRRANESHDSEHGKRGAKLAEALRDKYFNLSDEDFEQLQYACDKHTDGLVDNDVTIQTCWDADRLDLWRVGIVPRQELLSPTAYNQAIYTWAQERSIGSYVPEYVEAKWLK